MTPAPTPTVDRPPVVVPSSAATPEVGAPAAPAGLTSSRGRVVVLTAVAVVVLTVVVLAALVLVVRGWADAPALPGLPDAGPVTAAGLAASRVAVRVLAVLCVGALLVSAALLPGSPVSRRAARTAAAAAAGWALAALAQGVFAASELLAVGVTALPVDDAAVLLDLPSGRAAVATGVLAGSAALLALGARHRAVALAALLPATGALVVPQVLAGHSAAEGDHLLAVALLSVHVVVATVWVGGLVALVLLVGRSPELHRAAARFSVLALCCFTLTGVTGLAGAWVVVDGSTAVEVLTSPYGALLGAKTALLAVLGVVGWWHRRRTLPLLATGTRRSFARFAAAEVLVMLVATGLAVALAGTAPPPAASSAGAPVVPAGEQPAGAAPPAAEAAPGAAPGAEDMSTHDHGDLTVGVLVDDERFHVAGPVTRGQAVTVFNRSTSPVTLTADDGSFDLALPGQTLTTFTAPADPGSYAFSSTVSEGFADVLVVQDP